MARKSKPAGGMNPDNALRIEQSPDETGAQAMARKLMQPALKNAAAASTFTDKMIGSQIELPGLHDYVRYFQDVSERAAEGDLGMASRMLAAQAVALDCMFAELARRCAMNMGDYINASERYGRLALKAQSNCRATLEALAKLHQPREQTVRHVHVNQGGQAVVADHFHAHSGGSENAKSSNQCHATGTAGSSSALPCPDAHGNGVPISGNEGEAAMQDARRNESGRT